MDMELQLTNEDIFTRPGFHQYMGNLGLELLDEDENWIEYQTTTENLNVYWEDVPHPRILLVKSGMGWEGRKNALVDISPIKDSDEDITDMLLTMEDMLDRDYETGDHRTMFRESKGKQTMKISKRQLKQIIREEYSKLKGQGLIKEIRNVSFPFTEIAEFLQDRGYQVKKANAGDTRGSALFQMPISLPGGTKDLGYYIDVKYEYGTFYFYWYLRTKQDPSNRHSTGIKVMRPGGGKPRWEVEYIERDLKIVLDEIDHEIAVHDAEGIHPFDQPGYGTSKFAYKG